jgi:hypothetical protein
LEELYGCISQKFSIPDFMDKLAEFWHCETVERRFLSAIRLRETLKNRAAGAGIG